MSRISGTSDLQKTLAAFSLEKFATTLRADFRFAPLNVLLLVGVFVIGLVVHLATFSFTVEAVVLCLGSALVLSALLRVCQVWEAVVVLGTAETEIAEKFATASEHYRDNAVALHLRAMNMVFEGLRQKGSMIIVPSTAVETMGLGALGGLTAFGQNAPQGPRTDRGDAESPDDSSGEPASGPAE